MARRRRGDGSAPASASAVQEKKLPKRPEGAETKRSKTTVLGAPSAAGGTANIEVDVPFALAEHVVNSDTENAVFLDSDVENAETENSPNLETETGNAEIVSDPDSDQEESDDSDSDQESRDPEEIKSSIVDILDDWYDCPFTHALGKMDGSIPPPHLVIDGFGYVPLPVNGVVAKELVKYMERSPYGHGEKTITDPKYRNSYQINPDKFEIKNQNFTNAVKRIVGTVAEEFCFSPSNVTALLYKFLLYEPGGLFKPHKDTEKEHGMFATLIIQLPSVFTGGEFRVEHNGKTKTFDLSQQGSEINSFYIAHFASCTHELRKIESGYRVAVVYNLCWTGDAAPPILPENRAAAETLRELISQYLETETELGTIPESLVWLLEHSYTDKALKTHGMKALKGKDAFVVKQLMDANEDQNENDSFEIVLAEATKREQWSCETHAFGYKRRRGYGWYGRGGCELGECHDSQVDLDNLICLTSSEPETRRRKFRRWDIEPDEDVVNFDEDDRTFWGDPKDECGGPTGNEGATVERWYSRRVVIVYFKSR